MAPVLGGRRWPRWALLVTLSPLVAVGLALLACGDHMLRRTGTSTDVAEETAPRADALAPADETIAPLAEDTRARPPCSVVTGKYGACEAVLGWGFDGRVCRQWTGCDCAPDCEQLSPSAQGCAQLCRKQGQCNAEALVSRGVATFAIGGTCDSLVACVPVELEGGLGLELSGPCQSDGACAGAQTCPLELPDIIDGPSWEGYCAASLLAGVRLECFQRLL